MPFLAPVGAALAGAASSPLGGAALSAGLGFLGNSQRKGSPGSGGTIAYPQQYSFTEPRMRLLSDFVSDNISRAGRGQAPAYFDRAVPDMRAGLERGVQTTYFGRPGDRTGSVQAALEAGSIAGTGPKPGSSMVNKALQRYEDAGKQIEEYISNARMNATQTSIGQSLQAGIAMPKGPDAMAFPGYGAQTTGGGVDSMAGLAGALGGFMAGGRQQGYQQGGFTPSWAGQAFGGNTAIAGGGRGMFDSTGQVGSWDPGSFNSLTSASLSNQSLSLPPWANQGAGAVMNSIGQGGWGMFGAPGQAMNAGINFGQSLFGRG